MGPLVYIGLLGYVLHIYALCMHICFLRAKGRVGFLHSGVGFMGLGDLNVTLITTVIVTMTMTINGSGSVYDYGDDY